MFFLPPGQSGTPSVVCQIRLNLLFVAHSFADYKFLIFICFAIVEPNAFGKVLGSCSTFLAKLCVMLYKFFQIFYVLFCTDSKQYISSWSYRNTNLMRKNILQYCECTQRTSVMGFETGLTALPKMPLITGFSTTTADY